VIRIWLWAIGLGAWLLFLGLALRRVGHPLELGNLEGVIMDHVVRIAHGRPIYVEPSLEFIPLAYTPLYPLVVAPLARWWGPAFWEGRLIALLATLGLAAIILVVIARETRSRTLALAGSAIFLMGFGITRGCYDLVQPNSLMMLLAFAGLATLRFTRGAAGAALSALLIALGFFTKQHVLCFGAAALIHLAWNDRRRLMPFALGLALFAGGGFLLLDRWLGPWFSFYVWDVPRHWSQLSTGRLLQYLAGSLLGALGASSVPALLALALPGRPWRGATGLWWWAALGGVATGLLASLDPYVYLHNVMPTVVSLAVLGPIALDRLAAALWPTRRGAGLAVAGLLITLQFVPLLFPARTSLPRAGSAAAREPFLARLKGIAGPAMVPFHGFYGWSTGHGSSLHVLALDDVIRARGNRLLARDPRFFERMFARLERGPGRPVIVNDLPLEKSGVAARALWASIAPGYLVADSLGTLTEVLRPLVGFIEAPKLILVPREDEAAGARP